MENFCAIPLGPAWFGHLAMGHIVLKALCLLLSARTSFIASEVISLWLAVAVIKRRRHRNILFPL
jgi:hypothetical protein